MRFDETALVVEVDYCGALLRHYAFPDRWFKINCTADVSGDFVEEQARSALIPFCFNCDIATPAACSVRQHLALWLNELVLPWWGSHEQRRRLAQLAGHRGDLRGQRRLARLSGAQHQIRRGP